MTENNNVEIQTSDAKGIRKGYLFLSFIPFAIVMAVQTATTLPGVILAMIDMNKEGLPMELSVMMEIFNKKYAVAGYVAYCVICIAIFIPWYYKGIVKKSPKVDYRKALGIQPVAVAFTLLVGLFFVIVGFFVIADTVFPNAMNRYYEFAQMSSLGTNMAITLIYGDLLGPVTEELCFRGLMYGLLEKSRIHYLLAILIQGLLFGILHMNLVQGIYAFFLGSILCYIRYRYKTVIITIGAHIIFNIFGTSVEMAMDSAGVTNMQKLIFASVAAVISVILLVVLVKDKKSYIKEPEDTKALS